MVGAVAASVGLLAATLTVPPLRTFLNLAVPGPLGWTLIGAGTISSVLLNQQLTLSPPTPTRLALAQGPNANP